MPTAVPDSLGTLENFTVDVLPQPGLGTGVPLTGIPVLVPEPPVPPAEEAVVPAEDVPPVGTGRVLVPPRPPAPPVPEVLVVLESPVPVVPAPPALEESPPLPPPSDEPPRLLLDGGRVLVPPVLDEPPRSELDALEMPPFAELLALAPPLDAPPEDALPLIVPLEELPPVPVPSEPSDR
jgi:hypothetical protein